VRQSSFNSPSAAKDVILYDGKYDFYQSGLSFLASTYSSSKAAKGPQYELLCEKILTYQAKDDNSGRLAISESRATGIFEFSGRGPLTNPFDDEKLDDPIYICDGTRGKTVFSADEKPEGGKPGAFSDGFACKLEMDGDKCGGCGMISSVRGSLKMHRVWSSEDGTKELFEGYFSIRAVHGPTLRRKGHGPHQTVRTPFWAVRARRDEHGEELGLDIGNKKYVSYGGDFGVDNYSDDDDDSDEYW